jgi:ribokinase
MTQTTHLMPFDVIVGGSLHLDIMVSAPALPRVDETTMGSEWGMKCGGKGGNQAVMAAKAGVRVAMIGAIGADDFGDRLAANLEEAGVDQRGIAIDPLHGSGMSVAILQDDGEYGAVVVSGANRHIAPGRIKETLTRLGGGPVLVLQNEIPEAVNQALAESASASGAVIILNAAPYRSMASALLDKVDVLVLNRIEASEFFETPITTLEDATAALAANPLLPKAHIVVTLGGRGLVVAGPALAPTAIAPVAVKAVSSHGAGDCFVGVMAAALAKGHGILEAARHANRHAATFVGIPEDRRKNIRFEGL